MDGGAWEAAVHGVASFQIIFHYRSLQGVQYISLCYKFLWVIYFIYSSVYILIPNS